MGFSLDYSHNVFCEMRTRDGWFIEPITSAVSLIISENIRDDNEVCTLFDRLCCKENGYDEKEKVI